jgi:hypothetical protein
MVNKFEHIQIVTKQGLAKPTSIQNKLLDKTKKRTIVIIISLIRSFQHNNRVLPCHFFLAWPQTCAAEPEVSKALR